MATQTFFSAYGAPTGGAVAALPKLPTLPAAAPARTAPSIATVPRISATPPAASNQGGTFLGAKEIDYKSPGSWANFYGIDASNITAPGQFLDKFRTDAVVNGITSGGNEGMLKTLRSVDYGNNPAQFKLLQQYLDTGTAPGLDPNYAITNYDYAAREQGRLQQTKSPSLLGSLLKSVIGPSIGALLLGPAGAGLVSAAAGGAIGGGVQGFVEGGPKGAVFGAASGYGVGSGIDSISNFISGAAGKVPSVAVGSSGGVFKVPHGVDPFALTGGGAASGAGTTNTLARALNATQLAQGVATFLGAPALAAQGVSLGAGPGSSGSVALPRGARAATPPPVAGEGFGGATRSDRRAAIGGGVGRTTLLGN